MATNEFIAIAVGRKIEKMEAKQPLYNEGEPAEEFFALVNGSVLLKSTESVCHAPATLAIEDILHSRNYTDNAISAEPISIIRIKKSELLNFVKLCPTQALAVMERLAGVKKQAPIHKVSDEGYTNAKKIEIAKRAFDLPDSIAEQGKSLDIPTEAKHLHPAKYTCPVCGTEFMEKSILYSLLRTVKTGFDLRIEFKDFDPMWYNILVCPSCKYSNQEKDFANVGRGEGVKIKQKLIDNGIAEITEIYSNNRTVDEVIIAHYIAASCVEELSDNEVSLAKLWLNIVWLYEDVGDDEMVRFASQKALEKYNHIYQFTRKLESPEAEQQIFMIMAELCLRLSNKEQAMQFLSLAFKSESSNRVYKEKCRRKYEDLKYEGRE